MSEFILALIRAHDKLKKSTLYHFLNGKRTSSTLIFGYLNDILPYFGLFRKMKKETFDAAVLTLVKSSQLMEDDGILIFKQAKTDLPKIDYPTLAGYPNTLVDEKNWKLFLFSVQVVANLTHGRKNYSPLVTDWLSQRQLKIWLATYLGHNKGRVAYVAEIKLIFEQLDDAVANALSAQFTGGPLDGLIYEQIYSGMPVEKYLHYKADLHAFLDEVQKTEVPLLNALLNASSDSMGETQFMINQGADLAELEQHRPYLKLSTLRDHVLESAILAPATFSYERFYDKPTLVALQNKLSESPNLKAWTYQELVAPANDFLTFRLFQVQQLQQRKERESWM